MTAKRIPLVKTVTIVRGYTGRHKCGWITDGSFMIRCNLKRHWRKVKLAYKQKDKEDFDTIIKHFGELVPSISRTTDYIEEYETYNILFARGSHAHIQRIYMDWLDSLGLKVYFDVSGNEYSPLAIMAGNDIVGAIMRVKE